MKLKITPECARVRTRNGDVISAECLSDRSDDNRVQYHVAIEWYNPPGGHVVRDIRSGVGDKPEPQAGLRAFLSFLLASLETYHRIEREGRSPTREEWGELGLSPATIEWADQNEDELTEFYL
jgi:hypothetical protein